MRWPQLPLLLRGCCQLTQHAHLKLLKPAFAHSDRMLKLRSSQCIFMCISGSGSAHTAVASM